MKKQLFFVLVFCLAISCVSKTRVQNDLGYVQNEYKYTNNDSVGLNGNNLNCPPDSIHDDFPEFWNIFRNQILSKDSLNLYGNIHFPLLAFGYEDDDPVYVVSRADINWFLTVFLTENGYDNTEQIKDITCVTKIPWYRANQEEQSVGQMTFMKYSGEWKLCTIYINTKNIPKNVPCSPSDSKKETLLKELK